LAHRLRDLVTSAFQKKLNLPSLGNLYKAFCDTLVPDLTAEQFADMYAQTIAYGLFAARCNSPNGTKFTRQYARDMVPKTNPFLRNIFDHIAGAGLPEIIAPEVDDVAQLLAQADMDSVLKDFGKRTAKEDPVVHFYETFLAEYNPKVREMRGVYYTPEPVVSYIVRSIDHLLKTRFSKLQGLADDKTLILDPAVGTATFLYLVMNEIHESMLSQKQKGMWNDYVADKLLPRIFGFELLMAPYAVAHLKLGLLLLETGYQFKSNQRLGIYLTNTLEEAIKHSEVLFAQWISEEANAAAQIKKEKPIMVVLGNPPYSVSSLNRGEWIDTLLDDYKTGLHEKKLNIDDDYIKFIRFAQWRIDKTGYGILGFITNNSYLDGLTHRRMREHLLESFSNIYILNLHGSSRRGEQAPGNIKDDNVFDIQQGVAIGIFVKEPEKIGQKRVYYADMWGAREIKYRTLSESGVESTDWQELTPVAPHFFFVPKDFSLEEEYSNYWSIKDILPLSGPGIKTERDRVSIHWTIESVKKTLTDFTSKSEAEIREIYQLGQDSRDWKVGSAKADVIESKSDADLINAILYRPFDTRYTYYTGKTRGFIGTPDRRVMQHMAKDNIALLSCRQQAELGFYHILCSNKLAECCAVSLKTREITSVFPLYLYPAEKKIQSDKTGGKEAGVQDVMPLQEKREPNLKPEFIEAVSDKLGLKFVSDGKGDLKETFGPEDIFNYAYAVFHSPTYRSRYAEFLRIDFPRLPLTSDKGLFQVLAEKGAELVTLHLMEAPALEQQRTQIKFDVSGSNVIDKVTYNETGGRVYINKQQYFEGAPPEVWVFQIGGYQICQKWLKDRKGRKLSYDDLVHYQKIVAAIKETIRLMAEIDEMIPEWPVE